MPELEVPAVSTAPVDQPSAQPTAETPKDTALTREEVTQLIATARTELRSELLAETKRELDAAYKTARRSESKGDTAHQKIATLESRLEELSIRGMDESEARAWKAERALERANEAQKSIAQQQEYEQQANAFQQRSASYLASEGIKPDDPRLTAAFSRLAADAKTYDDWDKALISAVAAVHKDNASKAAAEREKLANESKTAVERAREEERAKLRNEQRTVDGPVDKGLPASTPAPKKTWEMTDEEFKTYDAARDAERRARLTQLIR